MATKLENVTSTQDPETFTLMCAATTAWLAYYQAENDMERHTTTRTHRNRNRAKRIAQAAQAALERRANAMGYII